MRTSDILGLNARAQLFSYQYNKSPVKRVANSKLATKRILRKEGIPVPKTYARFKNPQDLFQFDWGKLPSAFALKPNKGLGGEGIIVVKKKTKDDAAWLTTSRKRISEDDLKLHVLDIMEGAYSINNVPDAAFVEEYVGRHRAFRKYAFRGTPDIRVIVFNKVPVMAMLRLPTKESGGRANLHQGAIAVGVDIATGITTKVYWKGEYIRYKPDSKKRKLHGVKIPNWEKIMEIAVRCQEATGIGYLGVDVVMHPEKGPMILELNTQPGLSIQLANQAGLKRRLERVADLQVKSAEHGVRIAKSLFMSSFSDRVKADEGVKIISAAEEVTVKGLLPDRKRVKVMAKIDTGAWRTSISDKLARELGLLDEKNILWTKKYKSALGSTERPAISLTFWLAGRKITTPASVAKRMSLKFPIIIGRKNLKTFLVDPRITKAAYQSVREMEHWH
jgi:alpha-L-glutamate ligase-like protein